MKIFLASPGSKRALHVAEYAASLIAPAGAAPNTAALRFKPTQTPIRLIK